MKQNIYYKETGFDKTIYKFFILEKETPAYVFLRSINKVYQGPGVVPGDIVSDLDLMQRISKKKFNVYFYKWNDQPLIENHNYTYKGPG